MQNIQPPPKAIELFSIGLELHQIGKLDEAEKYYKAALMKHALFIDALHFLGVIAAQKNQFEAAIALIDQAIAISPNHEGALTNRGLALHRLGQYDAALKDFEHAISVNEHNAQNYYNRGNTLQELKQYEAALQSYDKAIAIDPLNNNVHYNRGNTLQELKQYEAALQSYDKAIAIDPLNAEAFNGRGVTNENLKNYGLAIEGYEKAISIDASYASAYFNLANTLHKLERHSLSLTYYEKSHKLKPKHIDTLINLANTLRMLLQYDKALENYQKALALNPTSPFLAGMALHLKMMMCDWSNFDSDLDCLSTLISDNQAASEPFPILGLLNSPQLQLQLTRNYQAIKFNDVETLPPLGSYKHKDKIRLGYFSADFREHPVSNLLVELFEKHDSTRFETFAFSFGVNTNDPMRNRLIKAFDHFIDVENNSDLEIAKLSRFHEIDIAIDLGGYTAGSRPKIFATRAAPVQVSYIGYLGTMSTNFMDYIIADKTLIPPELKKFYSEKIAYLPSYQANTSHRDISEKPVTRTEHGIPEDAFVFCCFNNNYKITPPIFKSWMKILSAVKGSVLYLYSENSWVQKNLENAAISHGIEKERLIFGRRLPLPDYLARYKVADLFLDTFPYNAGTTASDSLWVGTPILTLIGETFSSRMAASLLIAIDMPELIAKSANEYEDLAIKIAQNKILQVDLKNKLQINKLKTRLFDTPAFVQSIEGLYLKMHQRSRENLLPEDIEVGA